MVRDTKLSPEGEVDSYPLSPLQLGMLYHRLRGGAPGVDVEQVVCELHEPINAARFEAAWCQAIERHPALRTAFVAEPGGTPRQVVFPMTRVRFACQNVEFGSVNEARRGLEDYLAADRRAGFAELVPPLLRVALFRGGPEHFWFVTTYHHLVLDARAMTVLFREVLDAHDALGEGRVPAPAPPPPYRAYVDWLQTLDPAPAEIFWRRQLAGFTAATPLPLAAQQGRAIGVSDGGAGELAFRLSPAVTQDLRAIAQRHEVTLNTLTQAAWAVVLSRHAGEDDVVFGALRACRRIPVVGAAAIVGLLINTVPVRVAAPAAAPLGPWLRELRAQWIALRAVEHTPLVNVQQWSEIAPGRPLFETVLSFQEPAWDEALRALGGAWAGRHFDIRAQPNTPLALEVLAGAALTVKFIYDHARYADAAVARLMGHFRVVLEALAAGTAETVGELPLLTTREEEELLVTWNWTAREYPREQCVHDCVEAQAALAPERLAVADPVNALTFGALNARANRLAWRLRSLGAGPDVPVAVCMERSAEMLVAWLGILKAGAAFVPIDPAYPPDRVAFQLEDCGARVVVTQPRLRCLLPPTPAGGTVIDVAADGGGFDAEPDGNPPPLAGPRHLAYVIYTSGSTGRPKGVAIEHRALMNLVSWHQAAYRVTPADRASHLASPAFDASVWEIWPHLAAGASVHLPDDETRIAPSRLWRWLADRQITLAFLPTPLAEALLGEAWPAGLALRAILTGGDTLKRRPPAEFPCALINHYGPTESTVVATCAVVGGHDEDGAAPVIGGPIANTQAYVLDRERRVVPAGVAGELYLGGESLARGYLNRPELTAEKFLWVELPHERQARRLYRTGDLVRWTTRGELEFLGRLDSQVKVRGCRIELGEIESVLRGHPLVRECLVLARPDARGEPQLVAYLVPRPGARIDCEAELLEHLRTKLPAFMVPASFVTVPAWPLTPNGKIDRRALPEPASPAAEAGMAFAAPCTPVEQAVARVWSDVLGCRAVGRADNFFELGGHSLLAAQVVTRLNATFPGAASVRSLFDQPTLAAFAATVEAGLGGHAPVRSRVPRVQRREAARAEREQLQPN